VRPLCGYCCARHLPPGLKSLRLLLAVHAGWEAVAYAKEFPEEAATLSRLETALEGGAVISRALH
jgi:hypothetical protein